MKVLLRLIAALSHAKGMETGLDGDPTVTCLPADPGAAASLTFYRVWL